MEESELRKDKSNANTDSEGLCGGQYPVPQPRRRRVWGYWVVIILLLGACGILGSLWIDSEGLVRYYRRQLNRELQNYDEVISELRSQNDSLALAYRYARESEDEFRSKIADYYPLIITDIELEGTDVNNNVEVSAGKDLVHSELKYIRPVIKYTGLKPGKKTFNVRFINPDETVRKGTNSLKYYTYSYECEIEEGSGQTLALLGWGSDKKGASWPVGNYRLEIWCDSKCHLLHFFTVK